MSANLLLFMPTICNQTKGLATDQDILTVGCGCSDGDGHEGGKSSTELVISMCPRVPLPASFRPSLSWTDSAGRSWNSCLPDLQILLQDLFLPIPHHVQIRADVLFEVLLIPFPCCMLPQHRKCQLSHVSPSYGNTIYKAHPHIGQAVSPY